MNVDALEVLGDRRIVGGAHARAVLDAAGPAPMTGDLPDLILGVVVAIWEDAVVPPGRFSHAERLAIIGLICDRWAHEGASSAVGAALAACSTSRRGRSVAPSLVAAAARAGARAQGAFASQALATELVTPLGDQLMPTLERRLNAIAGWAALAGGERHLRRELSASGNRRAVAAVSLALLGPPVVVAGSGHGADARRLLRMLDDGRLSEVIAESERRLEGA